MIYGAFNVFTVTCSVIWFKKNEPQACSFGITFGGAGTVAKYSPPPPPHFFFKEKKVYHNDCIEKSYIKLRKI